MAVAMRMVLAEFGMSLYFATFLPAILLTALLAGVPAAAFSTVSSVVIVWWAFIPPVFEFSALTRAELHAMTLFVLFWTQFFAGALLPASIHPAERIDHRSHASPRLGHVARVGLREQRLGPARGELGGQRLARLAAAAGDRDQGPLPGRGPGDAGAQPRGTPADEYHPVSQQAVWPGLFWRDHDDLRVLQAASSVWSCCRDQRSATALVRMSAWAGGASPPAGWSRPR